MTPVGHICAGTAFAVLALPRVSSQKRTRLTIATFAILANFPDAPFPYWGHSVYENSHSFFYNFLWMLPVSLYFLLSTRGKQVSGGPWIVIAGCMACFSHILMDSTYNHGMGLRVWMPFSFERLTLPNAWLDSLRHPSEFLHTLRVGFFEFLTYGPGIYIALWFRQKLHPNDQLFRKF